MFSCTVLRKMNETCMMKFCAFLAFLHICNYALGKVTLPNCGKGIAPEEERIVGGKNARHGNYPFMASLNIVGIGHLCGAVIINENLLVTNAQCFMLSNDRTDFVVHVGLYKLSETKYQTVQELRISEIIIHPEFETETFSNDIALLRTATRVDISGSNGYVNGICLPETTDDPTGTAKVIGWGYGSEYGILSDILQEVQVDIVQRRICSTYYDPDTENGNDFIPSTAICAGGLNGDACTFDAGGPLFQNNKDGAAVLIGTVSYGLGCGSIPGVYTNIAKFKDWIESYAGVPM